MINKQLTHVRTTGVILICGLVGAGALTAGIAHTGGWAFRIASHIANTDGPGVAPVDPASAAAQHLRDLSRAILDAESLSVDAFASVSLLGAAPCGDAAPGSVGWGRFSYVARGDCYRLDSIVDPEQFPGMRVSVAYNGERFSYLQSNGVLSVGDTDNNAAVATLPNPLFELLAYLVPLSDDNEGRIPRWRDLRATPLPSALPPALVVCDADFEPLVRLVFPGAVFEGRSYRFHVYIAAQSPPRIVRVDRVTDGGLLARSEFSEHASISGLMFPRRVRMTGYDVDGSVGAEIDMSITHLSLNERIDVPRFSIAPGEASAVWDDVRCQFVARPPQ